MSQTNEALTDEKKKKFLGYRYNRNLNWLGVISLTYSKKLFCVMGSACIELIIVD